ncbi:MAG: TonB family protein [Spirochaetia bacterium]|nr:TonB family protein [Spirochaetia bacterium]
MRPDGTEISAFSISVAVHAAILLLLSLFIVQQEPRRVALITDVTLIDVKDYRGAVGQEDKAVGLEETQKKLATTIEKKTVKKTEAKKSSEEDVKSLLKKIEAQKSALDMGISREKLRETSQDEGTSDAQLTDDGAETIEEEVVAGGAPRISGQIAARRYRRIDWRFPEKLPEETELIIEITVMPSGIIKNVKLVRTSGYPELDRAAFSQARKMQFDPLPAGAPEEEQAGVLLFKFGAGK